MHNTPTRSEVDWQKIRADNDRVDAELQSGFVGMVSDLINQAPDLRAKMHLLGIKKELEK